MNFPLLIFKVSGHSMEPTLHEGQFVVVNRWAKPKVGDIVVTEGILLKRIKTIKNDAHLIVGDNPGHFKPKWINKSEIVGKVIAS